MRKVKSQVLTFLSSWEQIPKFSGQSHGLSFKGYILINDVRDTQLCLMLKPWVSIFPVIISNNLCVFIFLWNNISNYIRIDLMLFAQTFKILINGASFFRIESFLLDGHVHVATSLFYLDDALPLSSYPIKCVLVILLT